MTSYQKTRNLELKTYRQQYNNSSLRNRIAIKFQDDLPFPTSNPFSQQLSPWNQSAKLQTSMNLLKQQVQKVHQNKNKIFIPATNSANNQNISVQKFVGYENQYGNLAFDESQLHQPKIKSNHLHYPKLKINSNRVFVSTQRNQKVIQKNKQTKRSNKYKSKHPKDKRHIQSPTKYLTMQWDDDIIYDPEKKYLQEQNLKRKILRNFPQAKRFIALKDQSFGQDNRGLSNSDRKIIKCQLKNNKIHKKQFSIIEYNKKQNRQNYIQQKSSKEKLDRYLSINASRNIVMCNNYNQSRPKLDKESYKSLDISNSNLAKKQEQHFHGGFKSQKWRLRSSLKMKKNEKENKKRGYSNYQRFSHPQNNNKQGAIINRLRNNFQSNPNQMAPLQIFTRTSPYIFNPKK